MTAQPAFTLIVLANGGRERLPATLASVAVALAAVPGGVAEAMVVGGPCAEPQGLPHLSFRGRSAARALRAGLRAARGRHLAWLRPGDLIAPTALADAFATLAGQPGVDVLYGAVMTPAGAIAARRWDRGVVVETGEDLVHPPAAFLRADLLRALGLRDRPLFERDLLLRAAAGGASFLAVPSQFGTSAGAGRPGPWAAARDATRLVVEHIPPEADSPVRRRALASAYISGFERLSPRAPHHWLLALLFLAGALRADPAGARHAAGELLARVEATLPPARRVARPLRHLADASLDLAMLPGRIARLGRDQRPEAGTLDALRAAASASRRQQVQLERRVASLEAELARLQPGSRSTLAPGAAELQDRR